MTHRMLTTFVFAAVATTTACTDAPDSGTLGRTIIEQSCAADADCPTGFQCEIEEEHGTTTSYCISHESGSGSGSASCPAGYELEVEHGQAYCKPHGGDDGGTGTGTTGASCATDADCGAGLECELEHGQGSCQPHGG